MPLRPSTMIRRKLRAYISSEGYTSSMDKMFATLEKDPLFNTGLNYNDYAKMSLDQYRLLSVKRARALAEYEFVENDNVFANPSCIAAYFDGMCYIEWGSGLRYFLNRSLFSLTIYNSTKNPEALELAAKADHMEILGAFSLTELAHGSNTKGMLATAKYDPKTQEFIMNTPTYEAMKCWSGNLGQTATHALVYAQLYTPDGVSHGLHPFIVQVRTTEGTAIPGVTVGDMGHKLGLNSVANGYLLLENVHIPRTSLLNKQGDVTPDGRYVSPFKDKSERFGAVVGALSGGRVGITSLATCNLIMAITIATRYSFKRKQFGPVEGGEELPVIEYQMQQWRLFPYLAASCIWQSFSDWFNHLFYKITFERYSGVKLEAEFEANRGKEIHALSCSSKPVASWLAQHGIQEAREACGGHGYLSVNRLGDLRNQNDANCTYEGDNNCILMQTSNYLLSLYKDVQKGKFISSPYGSVDFMNNLTKTLTMKCCIESLADITPKVVGEMLNWLVCYLLKISNERFEQQIAMDKDEFSAKNDSQVYYCRSLSIAYVENECLCAYFLECAQKYLFYEGMTRYTNTVLLTFTCFLVLVISEFFNEIVDRYQDLKYKKLSLHFTNFALHSFGTKKAFSENCPEEFRETLHSLYMLYGLWVIEKNLSTFYQGNYFKHNNQSKLIRESILTYCRMLKPDALTVIDAISPPDWVLNSPIGHSNGKPLKNLFDAMVTPESQQRPSWWKDILVPVDAGSKSDLITSKL